MDVDEVDESDDFLDLLMKGNSSTRNSSDTTESAKSQTVDAEHNTDSPVASAKRSWTHGALATERLQTVAFECLVNGTYDSRVVSLLHTLGWPDHFSCFCIAGTPKASFHTAQLTVERKIRDLGGLHSLVGQYNGLCVAITVVEGAATPEVTCTSVAEALNSSKPTCLGPVRQDCAGACTSMSATINALKAAPALRPLPQPLRADDVLPERALLGDADARRELYTTVYLPLLHGGSTEDTSADKQTANRLESKSVINAAADANHGAAGIYGGKTTNHGSSANTDPVVVNDDTMLETVATFLEFGGSLDGAARELNVHPNTVRYRLKKAVESTGWDANNPREAFVLRVAIAIGRMQDQ